MCVNVCNEVNNSSTSLYIFFFSDIGISKPVETFFMLIIKELSSVELLCN